MPDQPSPISSEGDVVDITFRMLTAVLIIAKGAEPHEAACAITYCCCHLIKTVFADDQETTAALKFAAEKLLEMSADQISPSQPATVN